MTIAIIGAMDEEIAYFKEMMTVNHETVKAHVTFYEGKIENTDIILLKSGIGKVNAAMATTILMQNYDIERVINTGSAGGFNEAYQIGDIVIANEVVHHDADARAFNYELGQIPQMPARFKADPQLIKDTQAILESLALPHHVGLIGTADTFMADPLKVKAVREGFPDMIAAEMEAAAIAQVCYQYEVPFIVMRALSDIAGVESSFSFEEFIQVAAKNSTDMILKYIQYQENR